MTIKDVVIGAGIAGIGAYYAKNNSVIFEKDDVPGGLCAGFEISGYHFDNAVHLSFTTNSFVRNIFDKTEYYAHNPESYSWFHDKWLRHPAQNNLFPCTIEEKINAIADFSSRDQFKDEGNFSSWSRSQYGEWLYEKMFKPYNEKYWCTNLDELGIKWIGNRIYKPTIEEVLYGTYTDKTPNTYYAKEMRYPKVGGYYAFIEKIAQKAVDKKELHFSKKVVHINAVKHIVRFSDGEELKYETLYSSIPLVEMGDIVEDMPLSLKNKTKELENTSMALVSFGFNKKIEYDKLWCYFYDQDILASRAYMPSLKSENNVPYNCSSIQFEIYYNSREKAPKEKVCIDNCIYAMEKTGIANREDINISDYRTVKYANVIFKKGTEEKAFEINEWLKAHEIIPIGRFGEWKYLWSDQAFLSGYNAVMERNII